MVGAEDHVDINPGAQAETGRVGRAFGDAVIDKFADGIPVADDDAAETPLLLENGAQEKSVGRNRDPADLVERGHDRGAAGLDGRLEGRQVDLAQGALGDIGGVVVASALAGAVADEVLGAGGDALRIGQVIALEASHGGGGETGVEQRVLAIALGHPPPARVAGHVHHGCEGQANPIGGAFPGRDASPLAGQFRVPGGSLAEGDGKNRAVPVDDIAAEQQGDAEAAFLDRHALEAVGFARGGPAVAHRPGERSAGKKARAEEALADKVLGGFVHLGQLVHLADLLGQGHF